MVERREQHDGMKLAGNWNTFRLKEETSGKLMSTNVKLAMYDFKESYFSNRNVHLYFKKATPYISEWQTQKQDCCNSEVYKRCQKRIVLISLI